MQAPKTCLDGGSASREKHTPILAPKNSLRKTKNAKSFAKSFAKSRSSEHDGRSVSVPSGRRRASDWHHSLTGSTYPTLWISSPPLILSNTPSRDLDWRAEEREKRRVSYAANSSSPSSVSYRSSRISSIGELCDSWRSEGGKSVCRSAVWCSRGERGAVGDVC